jgi:hypothetical protein
MSRASQPTVYRYAIFVKSRRNGKTVYNRRPYDVVELDWRNGERYSYIQPMLGDASTHAKWDSTTAQIAADRPVGGAVPDGALEQQEIVYDDIRIYSSTPDFDLCAADHTSVSTNPADQPRGFIVAK